MNYAPNKLSSDGFYLHFPIGFKRDDVTPAAGCWYKTKAAAISEMVRLANLTNKSFCGSGDAMKKAISKGLLAFSAALTAGALSYTFAARAESAFAVVAVVAVIFGFLSLCAEEL